MVSLLQSIKSLKVNLMISLGFVKSVPWKFLGLNDFDLSSFLDYAPAFEISSNLVNLVNLIDYDIDQDMTQEILLLVTSHYLSSLLCEHPLETSLSFTQI